METDHNKEMDGGLALLDSAYADLKMERPRISEAMDNLILGLRDIRSAMPIEAWELFSRSVILHHPIKSLLHQDPFTRRNFEKPRGYDGDAKTLDFIYGYADLTKHDLTPLGKAIYEYTTNSPSCRAVRERRMIISRMIDNAAAKVKKPRIFSLACGHMREAGTSSAFGEGAVGEVVAMDYDKKCLSLVSRELSHFKITTVHNSVRELFFTRKRKKLEKFDLIYASGLYDYLSQRVAVRLTEILFGMLNHGGSLLLSNFVPHIRDVGYMETFMDWRLIYRNEEQLEETLSGVSPGDLDKMRVFFEENRNIVFLEAIKA